MKNPEATSSNELEDTDNDQNPWLKMADEAPSFADDSAKPTRTTLKEKIKRMRRYEVHNTGGSSKGGGVTIEVVKMPFGEKVGSGVLDTDYSDDDAAVLNAVYVKPKHRGRGLGSAITREAIAQAQKEGLKRINLNATDMATKMYKKHGFVTKDESNGSMTLELEDKDK